MKLVTAIKTVFAWVVMALVAHAAHAQASSQRVAFNIRAQSMETALTEFGATAGLQVFFPSKLTADKAAPEVVGTLSVEEALQKLLEGSSLRYEFINATTVAIREVGEKEGEPMAQGAEPAVLRVAQAAENVGTEATQQQTAAQDPQDKQAVAELEEVVVTGTHIRGTAPAGSPLTVITRQDIERSGITTIDRFVRTLPQNFSLANGESRQGLVGNPQAFDNRTRGGAINLFGLGPSATLVLVNGQRSAPSGDTGSFVDTSLIPKSAVERVEILTDGASAIYGSDAVAGVVNFVLRRDFEGAETRASFGGASDGGAEETTLSQLFGTSWASGNGMLAYEFSEQKAVLTRQRSFATVDPVNGFTSGSDLIPENSRHSVIAALSQNVAMGGRLTLDGSWSRRAFEQSTEIRQSPNNAHGSANQYGGTAALTWDLPHAWRSELSANYSRIDNQEAVESGGITFGTGTVSTLYGGGLKLDGSLLSIPGGPVRAALGTTWRKERFAAEGSPSQQRSIFGLFAEGALPFVGETNTKAWVHRLDLSAAVRLDRYGDVGSSVNPKIGVTWAPTADFSFNGTYGTSFRAPLLPTLTPPNPRQYYLVPIDDPSAPGGSTVTLLTATPENSALKPEKSRSFTAGIDFHPRAAPGLSARVTYFDIKFTDRIATPPATGTVLDIFSPVNAAVLAPFIHRQPSAAVVDAIFADDIVLDLFGLGLGAGDVQAIYDFLYKNIGTTRESGIESSVTHTHAIRRGELTESLNATYLLNLDARATDVSAEAHLLNTLYNPMDFRARAGFSWVHGNLTASLFANYYSDYRNTLVSPADRVASWLTADLTLGYRLGNLELGIAVQNLTNEAPPHLESFGNSLGAGPGYDPANASALGRFAVLTLGAKW